MTTMRYAIAAAGLAFVALSGAACDLKLDFEDRRLDDAPPPEQPAAQDASADEVAVRACTAVVPEATPEYEAMCRHYCDELAATLTYAGTNPEVAKDCYEQRCVPRCVSADVCVAQCHALGVQYQAACSDKTIAPDTACPASVDDRVDACLTGCGVQTGGAGGESGDVR
jgi:hypothetical protein